MQLEALRAFLARNLPHLTIMAGLGLVLLAFLVDIIGLGSGGGFGVQQAKLAVLGGVVALAGVAITPPIKRHLPWQWVMPAAEYREPAHSILRRFGRVLLLALWFGLLIGLTDLYHAADEKFIKGQITWLALPDVVWKAPMVALWITGAFGLALGLISWPWPRLASLRVAAGVFGFLLFSSLVFIALPKIHLVATFVLALGLAVVAARIIAAHPDRFYGLVRRTTLPLLVVVAGVAAGVMGSQWWSEHQALASLPEARPDATNVLLITLDTVRARSLSLYGYDRPTTPNLEEFARESATFDWPFSPSPWTLPAHGSMFTGRWPHELSADYASPLDDTYPTLAEALRERGYETAGFAANYVYGSSELGLSRGIIHYEDFPASPGAVVRNSLIIRKVFHKDWLGRFTGDLRGLGRKNASRLNGDFLAWLDSRSDPERPYFAFLNYFDAHDPYVPLPEHARWFAGKAKPRSTWEFGTRVPPEDIRELNDAYDASIAYLDEQLGLLLAELDRRESLDNTLVIITSDHGEHFGEHGLMSHGVSLYLPLTHVPLLISFPGRVPSDVRIDQPVTLRDLPATVVHLVGLESPAEFPGESLARYWETDPGSDAPPEDLVLSEVTGQDWIADWYPASRGDMKSLVADHKLYIKNGDGVEELYHIQRDPLEENNLALEARSQPVLEEFRDTMEELPPGARYRAAGLVPSYR